MKEVLSVREAAEYTGRSIGTIRRWIYNGTIPAFQPSKTGRWLINTAKLRAALGIEPEQAIEQVTETETAQQTG